MDMLNGRDTPSFQDMSQQQMEIYALELYKHFREERRLRGDLENLNRQLEQRVGELASLNKLFQEFLEEYIGFQGEYISFLDSYQRIVGDTQSAARDMTQLADKIGPELLKQVQSAAMPHQHGKDESL